MKQGLAILAVLATATAAFSYSGEDYITCNLDPNGDNFLALRACPSTKCEMIAKLGPDQFLVTMEPQSEGNWREVITKTGLQDDSYSGLRGWVYDKYICKIRY